MSDRITRTEIEELHGRWTARFEEALAEAPSSPAELRELAERHRQLARASDTAGQRRAFADAAERYEQAARETPSLQVAPSTTDSVDPLP